MPRPLAGDAAGARVAGHGGGGGRRGRAPVEGSNTLQTNATIRVIDLLGEGEIRGLVDGMKSVRIDGTPVQSEDGSLNIDGIRIEFREGLPEQEPLHGFPGIEREVTVGRDLLADDPQVRTIDNPAVNAVRVSIRFPRLVKTANNGDTGPATVAFTIETQSVGEPYQPAHQVTIHDKNTSSAELSWYVPLTGDAPHNLRVTRLTADSESDRLHNPTEWARYTEIIEVRPYYPYSALAAITAEAEKFSGQVHRREYDVYGLILDVPNNYDPETRTYDGLWDGTFKRAWSDNGAWVAYKLLTERRFGLGGEIAQTYLEATKWEFYAIARFNDELVPDGQGGLEPRFRFSGVISKATEAKRLLDHVLGNFQASLYYGGGTVMPAQERPEDAALLVGNANVIGGEFTYQDLPHSERYSAVAMSFNDPEDGYRLGVELVVDDDLVKKYGYRQTDKVAMFTTRRSQAQRMARYFLFAQEHESDTLEYRAGLDHAITRPGGIIKQTDSIIAGARLGFRIADTDADTTTEIADVSVFEAPINEAVLWQRRGYALGFYGNDLAVRPHNELFLGLPFYIFRLYPSGNHNVVFLNIDRAASVSVPNQNDLAIAARFWRQDEIIDSAWLPIAAAGDATDPFIWSTAWYDALDPPPTWRETLFPNDAPLSGVTLDLALVRIDAGIDPTTLTLPLAVRPLTADSLAGTDPALDWRVSVMLPDGTIETRAVTTIDGNAITLNAPLSKTPLAGAMAALESDAAAPRLWRVLSVSERDALEFQVVCRAHHPGKFAAVEDAVFIDQPAISLLPDGEIKAPTAVALEEYLYQDGNTVKTALSVSIEEGAPDVRAEFVEYQLHAPEDDTWRPLAFATARTADHRNATLGQYHARARFVDGNGARKSRWSESEPFIALGKTRPPGTPQNLRVIARPAIGLALRIDPPLDLDLDHYAYWVSATDQPFETAELLARTPSTEHLWQTAAAGQLTFWVTAHDTSDAINGGSAPAQADFTIIAPSAPQAHLAYEGEQMVLKWETVPAATFAIAAYQIHHDGDLVASVNATRFATHVDFIGTRVFTVTARDIAGNNSAAVAVEVAPQPPASPVLRARVIDNSVLFNYQSARGSLPLRRYEIRRSTAFDPAATAETKAGDSTFTIIEELTGGAYTYWWTAVDTAGNASAPTSATTLVSAPPDYTLLANYSAAADGWNGRLNNAIVTAHGALLTPVIVDQTWDNHFAARNWNHIAEQIAAGFDRYMQPGAETGGFETTIDYGTTLASALVTLTFDPQTIDGQVDVHTRLEYSADGANWSASTDGRQTLATEFRYVRYAISIRGADADDLALLNDICITLDVRRTADSGTAYANATDPNGTWVAFNKRFSDAFQPSITPNGNTPRFGVSNFADQPHPTGFHAHLFDTSGTRVSGPFSWATTGLLQNPSIAP